MIRTLHALGGVLVLLATSLRVNGAERQDVAKPQAAFRVVGYLPEWRMDKLQGERVGLVDELIYFSIEPTADGQIDAKRFTPKHRDRLTEIRKKYGTAIRVAIGGWHRSEHFAPMATDAGRRAKFVAALTQFCRDNAFAGADFDWEFPKGEKEVEAYGDLLAETKAAFAPHGLTVSVAVNRTQRLPKRGIDAVDAVHVMAYDDGPRHATPERAKEAVGAWLAQGVPPAKLVLGVPFYGRNTEDSGKTTGYAQLVEKHGPAADVDEIAGFYFNGPATIEQKTRTAREQGLGGVMIWEVGHDVEPDHPASLLRAIQRGRAAHR